MCVKCMYVCMYGRECIVWTPRRGRQWAGGGGKGTNKRGQGCVLKKLETACSENCTDQTSDRRVTCG